MKKNTRKNRVRFPGICSLAAELGVTRIHLYRVLTGERRSPRIEAHPKVKILRRPTAR
ncbi:MAG: hypothetical protein ONB24_15260 [candidate division KSB1 bacterium]|nr:hypothetical protein [candidate division KSB1 bacterium]